LSAPVIKSGYVVARACTDLRCCWWSGC